MRVWIVTYYVEYEGRSDDIRAFSTKEKAYEYIRNELKREYNDLIENYELTADEIAYYHDKYDSLCDKLKENYDSIDTHIWYNCFWASNFRGDGWYQAEEIEIDKES